MNKKIVIVGALSKDPSVYCYAQSFYTTLKTLGYSACLINYRPQAVFKNMPVFAHLSKYVATKLANLRILRIVRKMRPWLVLIIKGETLCPKTIRVIKSTGALVINAYPDNPFALWNGNSTASLLQSLPLFDCFLSWSEDIAKTLLLSGCRHVCLFPFAFDSTIFNNEYDLSQHELEDYTSDVCFIGTWEPKREHYLDYAIAKLPEVTFKIWGNHWHKNVTSKRVREKLQGNAIYGKEMILASRAATINLNFLRSQNAGAHNMRSLEIPAIQAFLLAEGPQKNSTLPLLSAFFTGQEELVTQIQYYLDNKKERTSITKTAYSEAQKYALIKQLPQYLASCPALATKNMV